MRFGWGIYICLMLILVQFASAVTWQVKITDCSVSAPEYFCGENIVASCHVNDTLSAQGVNQMTFTVGGRGYTTTEPASGDRLAGTWQVSIPVTATSAVSQSLDMVQAVASNGAVCQASANQNSAVGCWVNFSATRAFTVDCSCNVVENTVCGADNVATVTHVPGAGCTVDAYTTYGVCDYCDPEWIPEYTACRLNTTGPTDEAVRLQTRLLGYSTKSYRAGNEWCTLNSQVEADRIKPDDDGENFPCRLDYWLTSGRAAEGDSWDYGITQAAQNLSYVVTTLTPSKELDGVNVMRPLAFDFNNDGKTEIAVPVSSGVKLVSDQGVVISTPSFTGSSWKGQPAAFGVTGIAHFSSGIDHPYLTELWNASVLDFTNGGGIAGIREVGGVDHFIAYQYRGGWVKIADVDLSLIGMSPYTDNSGHGVSCYRDECYFLVDQGLFISVNLNDEFVSEIDDGLGTYGGYVGSVPVFIRPTTGDAGWVVAMTYDVSGGSKLFYCELDFGSCDVAAVGLDYVSGKIAAGQQLAGNTASLYFSGYTNESNVSVWKYGVATFGVAGMSGLNVYNFQQSSSELVTCASDPAVGLCNSNANLASFEGASFAVHKLVNVTTPSSVVSAVKPDSNFHYDEVLNVTAPFGDAYGTGTGDFGGESCSMGVCYAWSGWGTTYADGTLIRRSVNFAGYSGISTPAINISHRVAPYTCNYGAGITESDGVLAAGSSNGDLFIVVGIITYGTGQSYPCAERSFNGYEVWRFSNSDSSWTKIATYTSSTLWISSRYLKYGVGNTGGDTTRGMFCDNMGCAWALSQSSLDGHSKTGVMYITAASNTISFWTPWQVGALNGNGNAIYNAVKTPSAMYYTLHDTPQTYIIRQTQNDLLHTFIIDSSGDDTIELVGLHAKQGTDEVSWGKVQNSNSGVCTYNTTGTSLASLFSSSKESFGTQQNYSNTGDNTVTCTQTLYVASGGITTSTKNYPVKKWAYLSSSNYWPIIDPFWSDGGVDASGNHYVLYMDVISDGIFGVPSRKILEAMSGGTSGGVYHPELVQYADGNATTFDGLDGSAVQLPVCTHLSYSIGGSSCLPVKYSTAQYSVVKRGGVPQDGTGAFHLGPTDNGLKHVYAVSSVVNAVIPPSTSTGELTEYGCYGKDGALRNSYKFIGTTSCPKSIAGVSTTGSGFQDLVSYEGVFTNTPTSTQKYNFKPGTSALDGTAMIAVDVNSDTYADFVMLEANAIDVILSNPVNAVAYSQNLSMSGCRATFDPIAKRVTVIGRGVAAPDSLNLQFSAVLKSSKGNTIDSRTSPNGVNSVVMNVNVPDEYTVDLTVRDFSDKSASATCNFSAQFVVNLTPGRDVLGACSLLEAGEFNWNGDVSQYRWFQNVETMSKTNPSSDGANLQLVPVSSGIFHSLACPDEGLSVTTRISIDGTSNTGVSVSGRQNNVDNDVAGFVIDGNSLYARVGDGTALVSEGLANGWHNVTLELDQTLKTYNIVLDGELKGEEPFLNSMNGDFTWVVVNHYGGASIIDFIRTGGLTGNVRDVRSDEEVARDTGRVSLANCVAPSDRDFSVDSPGTTKYYPNVKAYCDTILTNVGGRVTEICSLGNLQGAVKYNQLCYKEAYNYCVDLTYPNRGFTEGNSSEENSNEAVFQAGMDGAAACQVALSFGVGTEKVLKPMGMVLLNIVTNNLLVTIIVLILIILGIAYVKRR